ncbi:MAG: DUF5683 domain-containing protein [Oscillibacter sp.]|nr:DUF5683 domain-containing protein [Oscillibacter sp.]
MQSNCYRSLVIIGLLLMSVMASAQNDASDRLKPKWLNATPKPSNSSFVYVIKSAMGRTQEEARNACFDELMADMGFEKGMSVTVNTTSLDQENLIYRDGQALEYSESSFQRKSIIKGKEVFVQGLKIDEYWVRQADGQIYLTTLYARSQLDTKPRFDRVELTEHYGMQGLWRSLIIPGWGQFHKKANLKGGLFLGGCAALAVGAVFMESQRIDYVDKITKTHDANLKRSYATKRDHFATGRNVCIGVGAALYIYNLIDAVAAPGARRAVVKARNRNGCSYAVAPTVLNGETPGLAASFTF